MTTLLPKDADNNIIPALRLRNNGAHTLPVTASASRNVTAFSDETKVVSIYATTPIHLTFGDSTVNATAADHYFPAGVYYDVAITGGAGKGPHNAYISALSTEGNGTLYISEKE